MPTKEWDSIYLRGQIPLSLTAVENRCQETVSTNLLFSSNLKYPSVNIVHFSAFFLKVIFNCDLSSYFELLWWFPIVTTVVYHYFYIPSEVKTKSKIPIGLIATGQGHLKGFNCDLRLIDMCILCRSISSSRKIPSPTL